MYYVCVTGQICSFADCTLVWGLQSFLWLARVVFILHFEDEEEEDDLERAEDCTIRRLESTSTVPISLARGWQLAWESQPQKSLRHQSSEEGASTAKAAFA